MLLNERNKTFQQKMRCYKKEMLKTETERCYIKEFEPVDVFGRGKFFMWKRMFKKARSESGLAPHLSRLAVKAKRH